MTFYPNILTNYAKTNKHKCQCAFRQIKKALDKSSAFSLFYKNAPLGNSAKPCHHWLPAFTIQAHSDLITPPMSCVPHADQDLHREIFADLQLRRSGSSPKDLRRSSAAPKCAVTHFQAAHGSNASAPSNPLPTHPRAHAHEVPLHRFWGGRGRKFKSCHSDQNRRFKRTSDFLLFSHKSSRNLAFSQYNQWTCSSLLSGLNKPIFRL